MLIQNVAALAELRPVAKARKSGCSFARSRIFLHSGFECNVSFLINEGVFAKFSLLASLAFVNAHIRKGKPCRVLATQLSHIAIKRGSRAQFPAKLSLNKVLNLREIILVESKVKTVAEKLSFILRICQGRFL